MSLIGSKTQQQGGNLHTQKREKFKDPVPFFKHKKTNFETIEIIMPQNSNNKKQYGNNHFNNKRA